MFPTNPTVPNLLNKLSNKNPITPSNALTMGNKAQQPGGLNTTTTNTLPKKQIATQQVATGNQENKANTTKGSMGQLMTKPAAQPIAQQTIPSPTTEPIGTQTNIQYSQPTSTPQQDRFQQNMGTLSSFNPLENPQVKQAYQKAQDINAQIEQSKQNQAQAERTNRLNPIPIGDQTGREAVIRNQYLAEQNALASQFQGQTNLANVGLTGTGQQLSGLSTATGYIPEALRYGGQGGGMNPTTQAQQYAQEVAQGTRSYDDAVSAMGLYGNAGKQFLDQAIRGTNPNFNFAQAQSLGQTQGTVAPQLNMAQEAINNLQNTFANQPWWKKFGVPALNTLSNMVSGITGFGLGSETEKQNAIKEARTQVSNALGSMTNTTPTSWTATVESWFPDNATPDQITAGVQQFSNLATKRQNIYGSPGSVQPFMGGQSTPSGGLTWDNI